MKRRPLIIIFCLTGLAAGILYFSRGEIQKQAPISAGAGKDLISLKELIRIRQASLKNSQNVVKANETPQYRNLDDLNGDPCALLARFQRDEYHLPQQLLSHLLTKPDLTRYSEASNRDFENLFANTYYGDFSRGRDTGTGLAQSFFNALYLAGLLSGMEPGELNLTESLELLDWLKIRDPENGAYDFFLAAVKNKMNAPSTEIARHLELAASAPKAHFFITDLTRRIWERGLADPFSQQVATEVIFFLPIPDFTRSYRLMLSAAESDPQLRPKAIEFGKKLMEEGIQFGTEYREFIYWTAIQHNIGWNLYRKLWPLEHPDQVAEKKFMQSYKEILALKTSQGGRSPSSVGRENSQSVCSPEKLAEDLARLRSMQEKFQATHGGSERAN